MEKVGKQHNSQQPLDHLDNLLATPIQRLPWYNVLLNDLIGCTDKEHPDYGNITKARDLMAQVSDKILKSVKVGESQNKLLTIQLSFSDTDRCNGLVSRSKPLVQPHREFVLEADFVTKDGKKGESSVHIILCNDVIIFTKKKRLSSVLTFVLCEPIGICSASKCESSKSDFSIQWGTATEEEEGYVLLEASSEEERDMWANKVNELSEKINAQIKDKIMRVVSLNTTEDEATIKAEEVFNQEVHFENMSIFDSIVIEVSDEIIEMEF